MDAMLVEPNSPDLLMGDSDLGARLGPNAQAYAERKLGTGPALERFEAVVLGESRASKGRPRDD
jgi:hypothetical protein